VDARDYFGGAELSRLISFVCFEDEGYIYANLNN
jgi:hypothetical protein